MTSATFDGVAFDETAFLGSGYLDPVTLSDGAVYPRWQAMLVAALRDAGKALLATSVTPITPAAGTVSLTLSEPRPFAVGARVVIADPANPDTRWLFGVVSAIAGTSLTVNVTDYTGTAGSNWIVSISGPKGPAMSSPVPIAQGGTGSTTVAAALAALGLDHGWSPGDIKATAAVDLPVGWLWCDGSNVSRANYSALFAAISRGATVTWDLAGDRVLWVAHGLKAGDPISFETGGSVPSGLSTAATYYVLATGLTTDAFKVSATVGGAAIDLAGTPAGTTTCRFVPFGRGDGVTTFGLPDLRNRVLVGRGDMGGSDAGRVTTAGSGIAGATLGAAGGSQFLHGHTHNTMAATGSPGGQGGGDFTAWAGWYSWQTSQSTGAGASQNMPPAQILNYIIKA